MTGYGRATGETPSGRVTVEVRSLNHRYLDMGVKAPRTAMVIDSEIRSLVRKKVSRGKVEIFVTLEERPREYAVDTERALEMAKALEGVARALGDTVRLEHLIMAGEIVPQGESEFGEDSLASIVDTADMALDSMVEHRLREGASLAVDLTVRIDDLSRLVEKVGEAAPKVTERTRQNMQQFLDALDLGEKVDPTRLEVEVALAAQRSDIAEEMTRLRTHMDAFKEAVAAGGVIGRRLDFLVQEIQREINTIGSKSGLPEISEVVVGFKTDLEKVREQVQNIE
ncbi:MAG: YicC family protein [bacterium]|nr:YicC family protein [bacterium]